jgi:hypothetical protein
LSGEVDKFGGDYANVRSPSMTITVEKDADLDLGEIELKTRPDAKK